MEKYKRFCAAPKCNKVIHEAYRKDKIYCCAVCRVRGNRAKEANLKKEAA